jgi:hypothetical protein
MVGALVQFTLPQPATLEQARATFLGTAPRYQDAPGLIRKCYLLSEDGGTAGGFYLWESREAAERVYTDEWKAFILEKHGSPPVVTYFESPVVVDNLTHEILS